MEIEKKIDILKEQNSTKKHSNSTKLQTALAIFPFRVIEIAIVMHQKVGHATGLGHRAFLFIVYVP